MIQETDKAPEKYLYRTHFVIYTSDIPNIAEVLAPFLDKNKKYLFKVEESKGDGKIRVVVYCVGGINDENPAQ